MIKPVAVVTKASFIDAAMTTRVRGALLSDPKTRQCPIEVHAANGTVILSGKVSGAELALRAQQLALTVKGVDLVWTDLRWSEVSSIPKGPSVFSERKV
ncbi:MAG: BON domain-containing protein [Candidatus Binataceae bacterium]